MVYSKFSYIYKYIYFTNKANPTKYEKIQLLYDEIIINSQNIYIPEKPLSLDEYIIKYTGRCNFKVFILQKPTRKCLKIYMLSESKTGFILNWLLYTEKMKIIIY